MVKVHGPMMSLDASGTLGEAVTYSKWKGRNYARQRTIPSNPKSGAQVGRRAMVRFLTPQWEPLSSADKLTWKIPAEQLIVGHYHAFISGNMQRWHNFEAPGQTHPVGDTGSGSSNTLSAATWIEHQIRLRCSGFTLDQAWGKIFYASETPAFTPAVDNAIMVVIDDTIATHDNYWTPPRVNTWYFRMQTFSDDGHFESMGGQVQAVPP